MTAADREAVLEDVRQGGASHLAEGAMTAVLSIVGACALGALVYLLLLRVAQALGAL